MRNRTTIPLLSVAIGIFITSGCADENTSALRSENTELKAELTELKLEIDVLTRKVDIALSAATNSLQLSRKHSQLIENINTQLNTISDAMVNALHVETHREKAKLLR